MKMRNTAAILVVLLGLVAMRAQSTSSKSYVEFIGPQTVTVKQGQNAPIQLRFNIRDGYHINSNKPSGEELIPTVLKLNSTPDLVLAKIQYPAGEQFALPFDPKQKLSVYSGELNIRGLVIAHTKAVPGSNTIHGELTYQACDNRACYPPKKLPVEFNVKVEKASASHGKRSTAQTPHVHQ